MPKRNQYPRLRKSVKHGKAGQTWVSYWFDNRGTGRPDIPLGTDHAAALIKWAEITTNGPRIVGTLEEAFQGWEQRGIAVRPDGRPRAAETIQGYRKCLRELRPAFGGAAWSDITMPVLRRYIDKRSAKGRAKQEMQLLSVIWGWARLEGLTALPWPALGMQKTGWMGAQGKRQIKVGHAYDLIYKHADQLLKDAMDIASATAIRVTDLPGLRLSDVRDGELLYDAGKTGKPADFDLLASKVLPPIIARRKAMRGVDHVFLLAKGKRPVTLRMLTDRFAKARAKAAKEDPACALVWFKDMRKHAGQLAPDLAAASKLLQHSSLSVTQQHYRQGDKLKPVR